MVNKELLKHVDAPVNEICRMYEKLITSAKLRRITLQEQMRRGAVRMRQIESDIKFFEEELAAVQECMD